MNAGAVVGASETEFDLGAHGGQQVARGLDIAHLRNVLENYRLIGEQGCGHAGQRGVFGAADANSAEERLAATNDEFIHRSSVIVKRGERRVT